MKLLWILDILLTSVVVGYLLLAPYTKVEESFNMQAIHDILNFGVYPAKVLENFDHKSFPGVVPRSFVGSLFVAAVLKASDVFFSQLVGYSILTNSEFGQLHVQVMARGILATLNILGFLAIRNSIDAIVYKERKTRRGVVGFFFLLLLLSQFHLLFYLSRTLPNFFALPIVSLAFSRLILGDMSGLALMAFAGVVFRLEVGVFASVIALVSSFGFGQSPVTTNFFMLAAGALVGLALTVSVDSYFWGRWLIPELEAFQFNILHGKSVEWGVEPYSAYFANYIPNFFRPPHVLALAIVGLFHDPAHDGSPPKLDKNNNLIITHPARNSIRVLVFSALIFVALISGQPHKEWRFIIYIVPILTLSAAIGLSHLWWKRTALLAHKLLLLFVACSFLLSWSISAFIAFVSSFNYPGGEAISFLDNYLFKNPPQQNITVHMDVPACMTGVTKFTELHDSAITFDKTENKLAVLKLWKDFDYLITTIDMNHPPQDVVLDTTSWELLEAVPAFAGINPVGLITTVSTVVKDSKSRNAFVKSVWKDTKNWEPTTLFNLLKNGVVLRDFMFVYKRVSEDSLPIEEYAPLPEEEKEQNEEPLELKQEPLEEVEPQAIREALNEEIDAVEDILETEFSQEAEQHA